MSSGWSPSKAQMRKSEQETEWLGCRVGQWQRLCQAQALRLIGFVRVASRTPLNRLRTIVSSGAGEHRGADLLNELPRDEAHVGLGLSPQIDLRVNQLIEHLVRDPWLDLVLGTVSRRLAVVSFPLLVVSCPHRRVVLSVLPLVWFFQASPLTESSFVPSEQAPFPLGWEKHRRP